MSSHDWMDDARCAGTDTEIFFPPTGKHSDSAAHIAYVLETFCHVCPVKADCLEDALATEETRWDRVGIRGGLTANQRGQVAKARANRPAPKPAKCGTVSGFSAHRRQKTAVCDPCKNAAAKYQRDYRAAKQEMSA